MLIKYANFTFQDPYQIRRYSFIISVTVAYRKIYASKMLGNCSCDELRHFSCNLIYIIIFALKCPKNKNKEVSEIDSS